MVSFLDNEGLKYYDERLKAWVEVEVEKSGSTSDKKIEELDNKVKTEVAQDVKLDLTEDYVLTVKLYSEEGTLISDDSVDLPIESLVKNGYYDEDKKEIVLELQDDTKIEIPVGDLVENKLDKTSTKNAVYANDTNGNPTMLKQSATDAKRYTLALRNASGAIVTAYGSEDNEAVTVRQLQDSSDILQGFINKKLNKSSDPQVVYINTSDGDPATIEYTYLATTGTIPMRNNIGNIRVGAPENNGDAANKKYVDDIAKSVMGDLDLLAVNLDDTTNTYYPNKEDKESFNTFRNSISGSNSIVGSKGFKLTQDNFHNACLGLFVIKPAIQDTLSDISLVKTMVCERYGSSQTLTVIDSNAYVDGANEYVTFLTQEPPYLYSEDVYSFSQITFKNEAGDTIGTLQPPKDQAADLIQWYGCVYQEGQLEPSTSLNTYVELQGNYYMPKADNIGAFYYVDIPNDVITQNLVNEPTCIKIDANFDSGTRQSYKDWGDDGTLTTVIAEQCLKANYTVGNSYLTLFLKKNKREGQGLEQAPIFETGSCIRFTDYPEIGNATVGLGFNNIFGDTDKGLFDFGFASGYGNTSIGRYSITGGTRNSAVYAGVALGNHNIVLGQSGFAAGATNFISRSGSNGIALGSENVLNGKNNVAGGRANNVSGLYGIAFGYGNKVRGNNGVALGYNNNQNDDLEFSIGLGNTLTGEGSITLGRNNQAYGNYNVCIGYGNITNNATYATAIGNVNHGYGNYSFIAGNNNTCYSDASGTIGINLKVNTSSDAGIYGNVGHFAVGSNNVINGGRNVIIGGQSNETTLHDSIMVGNNLKENSKGFGKAIFGNFNDDTSYASIVLGAGSKNNQTGVVTRRNVFEVYNDGRVLTQNATPYLNSETKRLTTKEYVDNKIATELATAKAAYEEVFTIDLYKQENGYYSESRADDIKAAYLAKRPLQVFLTQSEGDGTSLLPLMSADVNGDSATLVFGHSFVDNVGLAVHTTAIEYIHYADGTSKWIDVSSSSESLTKSAFNFDESTATLTIDLD